MSCYLNPASYESLRKLTTQSGSLLIFDEVITGFRVAYSGAQAVYGITPDLTCLGKIIGGGLPVGAYGGRKDIMELIAPLGSVYQAGTLSGNPIAMTAGIETLKLLNKPGVYDTLENKAARLEKGISEAAAETGVKIFTSRIASLLTVFFTCEDVTDYESAKRADTTMFNKFFHALLAQGIYWPPSQFEAAFVSLAHSPNDIQLTIKVIAKALAALSN